MMNEFFDISTETELSDDALQLSNLGNQKIFMSIGHRVRGDWGEDEGIETSNFYVDVTADDYDDQFISKLLRIRPSYKIDVLINHHFNYYISKHPENKTEFVMHMLYEIFPALKKRSASEAYIDLFGKWLNGQVPQTQDNNPNQTVNNNTINFGSVHAPIQFQQNSPNSAQTQHNRISQEQLKDFFKLLRDDIRNIDEKIREDFAMEMNYAIKQLEKGHDPKPQLSALGDLMKDVGINTFANVLSAPVFEWMKPFLGFQ
ncbi:hypothetical protein [Pedobacter sp. UYP1]|uniref:hypothetical protein n=1 Tax=Pedobacter sp. UYP1 TaxID=1756396 RepID=UPI003399CAD1